MQSTFKTAALFAFVAIAWAGSASVATAQLGGVLGGVGGAVGGVGGNVGKAVGGAARNTIQGGANVGKGVGAAGGRIGAAVSGNAVPGNAMPAGGTFLNRFGVAPGVTGNLGAALNTNLGQAVGQTRLGGNIGAAVNGALGNNVVGQPPMGNQPFYGGYPWGGYYGAGGFGPYGYYGANGGYGTGVGGGGYVAGSGQSVSTTSTTSAPAQTQKQGATDFVAIGEADFKAGRYQDAVSAWRHAIVDQPNNGVLMLMLSQALYATGKYDEAAGAIHAAMGMLPQEHWGLVVSNYGELYRGNEDYTQQLRALEAASEKKETDTPAVRFLLGYHYGYLGHPKQAVAQFDKLLAMVPQDEAAKQLRAIFAVKLGSTGAPATPPSPTGATPSN